jgi:alkanesulfonate monooxygenase
VIRLITVYSTCPSSNDRTSADFRRHMIDVAVWTESAGCRGLLVYTDNRLVDPWAAAQLMIERTERLVPLVAVQPIYMHPFAAARMIATIAFLYGRQVDLNLVTGGYAGHLRALDSTIDHDARYDRLVEYGQLLHRLLTADRAVTHAGAYYHLNEASLAFPVASELQPRYFVAGSSAAAVEAQRQLGALGLAYPRWVEEYGEGDSELSGTGMRVGIIARDTTEEAWRVAHERFPVDPRAEKLHDVAARLVESRWHRAISADARACSGPRGAYWLYPFRTYKTFCPYLVGTYNEASELLARYLEMGVATLILDVPEVEDDLHHASIVIRMAEQRALAGPLGSTH